MAITKVNERVVENLHYEKQLLNRENNDIRRENESLRSQNQMLKDSLQALVEDKSFWSEQAISSGIVWRLENVLKQINNI